MPSQLFSKVFQNNVWNIYCSRMFSFSGPESLKWPNKTHHSDTSHFEQAIKMTDSINCWINKVESPLAPWELHDSVFLFINNSEYICVNKCLIFLITACQKGRRVPAPWFYSLRDSVDKDHGIFPRGKESDSQRQIKLFWINENKILYLPYLLSF